MSYGNHNSVTQQQESFSKHMEEEIHQGWSLPLPPKFALDLKEAEAAQHGLVSQHTITKLGEIVEKDRVTHD